MGSDKLIPNQETKSSLINYIKGCFDPHKARLYGNFQERASLNITQFPKIQVSIIIRMGLVYPIVSLFVVKLGLPTNSQTKLFGLAINYHTWVAGYLAYLLEIQAGLSKYPVEFISRLIKRVKV